MPKISAKTRKYADLTVLDANPLKDDPGRIGVVGTIVGGKTAGL